MADANHVPFRRLDDCWLLANGTQGEDANLRLIDDGRAHDVAEGADVGHGVCSASGIIRLELSISCSVSEVVDPRSQTDQTQLVRVVNDRHDQIAGRQRRRHAQIDLLLDDNPVAVNTGIDAREIPNGLDNGLSNQRRESQFGSVRLLEGSLVALPPLHDFGHIDLDETGYVWAGLLRANHVIRDEFAHAVHLHNLVLP